MATLCETMEEKHGIALTEDQERMLMQDLHAVMEINKVMNLTRIVSEESGVVLHLEDSLTGLPYVNAAPTGLYGDLGTGGGFPGIPLAVMTGRKTMLVDSVQKKVKSLEGVAASLGLGDAVSTYGGRIEDLALEKKGAFSVLTARALSALPSLMELAAPLLKMHGRLVCYKAKPSDEELQDACDLQGLLGLEIVEDHGFFLSDGSERRIIVFEKVSKPHIKLPRRVGMAQKNPLKRD